MNLSNNNKKPNNNGNSGNNTQKNSNLKVAVEDQNDKVTQFHNLRKQKFDQDVILKQSPNLSRGVIWTLIGTVLFGIAWASIATIEQVVMAAGKLEPEGAVKDILAPVNGLVEKVYVTDGQKVKAGDVLLRLDPVVAEAELKSNQQVLQSLNQENQFYRAVIKEPLNISLLENAIERLKLPKEVAALAINRTELVLENELLKVQLGEAPITGRINSDQLARISASRAELNSRTASARLVMEQLEKQYNQNQLQIADTREQLVTARQVLREIQQRNRDSLAQAEKSLSIEKSIYDSIKPLEEEGALARVQIDRQQQEVNDRLNTLVTQKADGLIEYEQQQQQVQTLVAEIEQLREEQQRIRLNISKAREDLINTQALTEKQIRDQIAQNSQNLAQIDTQFNKLIVENEKRISELNSKISQVKQTIKYQEITAPVGGTVFDLIAVRGYVAQPNPDKPLLKIVPDDTLIASLYVTNRDIGFVRVGQEADVRIDGFPFTDYGYIKGKVTLVGSDALPPEPPFDFYRFPIEVALSKQHLNVNKDQQEVPLQSGMSVTTNIIIRENRTYLGLFFELLSGEVESVKEMR